MSPPDRLEDALGMNPPTKTLCCDCAHRWAYAKCRAFPTTEDLVSGAQSYGFCVAKNNGQCPDFSHKGFDWAVALGCLAQFAIFGGIAAWVIWLFVTGGKP